MYASFWAVANTLSSRSSLMTISFCFSLDCVLVSLLVVTCHVFLQQVIVCIFVKLVEIRRFVSRDVHFVVRPHLLSVPPQLVLKVVLHFLGLHALDEVDQLGLELLQPLAGGAGLRDLKPKVSLPSPPSLGLRKKKTLHRSLLTKWLTL